MSDTLFTNVSILDGSGAEPFPGEVLVAGNRIQAVSQRASLPRNGAAMVDGQGACLMPGLVESHVHMGLDNSDDIISLGALPPEEHTLLGISNARLYLDHGFTSCISGGSTKPRLDIVVRNAINSGAFPGPRLIASSPWFTVTGGLIDMHRLHMRREAIAMVLDGADAYRHAAREMIREGVDQIKLIISGDTGIDYAPSRATVMTEEEIGAVAEQVHQRGKRMAAHCRSAESIKRAIRHGIQVIYHATFADEEALDLLEAHRDRFFVSPNIGFTAAGLKRAEQKGPAGEVERRTLLEEMEAACQSLHALRKRKVRILGGGDYGFAGTPHGQNAKDIEYYVNIFGFSPMEAIQTMTKNGGEAMHLPEPVGEIRQGFLADILLVRGNPLEDVALLQNPANFAAIMKDGRFHKHPPTTGGRT
jgi:imidazolonepropionase-like amidohydrolase